MYGNGPPPAITQGETPETIWYGLLPGPKQRLFKALDELRLRRSHKSLRAMEAASGISKSTLSEVFPSARRPDMSDRKVPTWIIVENLVTKLNGDLGSFGELWHKARQAEAMNQPTQPLRLPRLHIGRHRLSILKNDSGVSDFSESDATALKTAERDLDKVSYLVHRGDLARSHALVRDVLKIYEKILGVGSSDTIHAWSTLAEITALDGDEERAIEIMHELLRRQTRDLGPLDRATLETQLLLALTHIDRRDYRAAEARLDGVIRDVGTLDSSDIHLQACTLRAKALISQGPSRCPEAIAELRLMLEDRGAMYAASDPTMLEIRILLTRAYEMANDWRSAVMHLRLVRDVLRHEHDPMDFRAMKAHAQLCLVLAQVDDLLTDAEAELWELLEIYQRVGDRLTHEHATNWARLIDVLLRQGKSGAAAVQLSRLRLAIRDVTDLDEVFASRLSTLQHRVESLRRDSA